VRGRPSINACVGTGQQAEAGVATPATISTRAGMGRAVGRGEPLLKAECAWGRGSQRSWGHWVCVLVPLVSARVGGGGDRGSTRAAGTRQLLINQHAAPARKRPPPPPPYPHKHTRWPHLSAPQAWRVGFQSSEAEAAAARAERARARALVAGDGWPTPACDLAAVGMPAWGAA